MRVTFLLIVLSCFIYSEIKQSYYTFLKGLVYESYGEVDKAIVEFEKTISVDPYALEAYKELAILYMNRFNYKKVLDTVEKLSNLSSDISTKFFIAEIYSLIAPEKTGILFEELYELDKENIEIISGLIKYYKDREPQKALKYIDEYLARKPDDFSVCLLKGTILEKLNRLNEAKEIYKNLIEMVVEPGPIYLRLSEIYLKEGNYEGAISTLKNCLAKEPQNLIFIDYLLEIYYKSKNYTAMEEFINNTLLKLYPNEEITYLWQSILFESKEDYVKAIEYLDKIQQKSSEIYLRMSYLYSKLKKPKESIEILKSAIKKEPTNPQLYLFLGLCYIDEKDYKSAEKHLLRVVEFDKKLPEAYFYLGVIYERQNSFRKSIKYFRKTIELEPEHAAALNYLGYMFAEKGMNLDEAEKLINRALKIEPENPAYIDSLGWVYYKKGMYVEAEKYLLKAVEKEGDDPEIFEHLGDVKDVLGKKDEAIIYWEKAITLGSKNKKEIEKKIKKVLK